MLIQLIKWCLLVNQKLINILLILIFNMGQDWVLPVYFKAQLYKKFSSYLWQVFASVKMRDFKRRDRFYGGQEKDLPCVAQENKMFPMEEKRLRETLEVQEVRIFAKGRGRDTNENGENHRRKPSSALRHNNGVQFTSWEAGEWHS